MKQTYEISIQDGFRLFMENKEFNKAIFTGGFIYCENRYVINNEKYVVHKDGKTVLTEYAKAHESECCLIFNVEEKQI